MAQNHDFGRRAYPPQPPEIMPDDRSVGRGWKWAITAAIAAVILVATYGVTTHRDDRIAANPPAATGAAPGDAGDGSRPGG